jgi:3-oxoadipate enol-lactonase
VTSALHHLVDGPADAPVLLLGSSLGTSAAMWAPQVPALAQQFRVVRFDHLGHGESAVPQGPYTIAQRGREVLALLDDLQVARASYAGLSLGGMVGMWLAAHAPERVDRLALLCTSALLGPPSGWVDRAVTVRTQGTRSIAEAVVARWFTPGWAQAHPDAVRRHAAMMGTTPVEGYAGCCEAIAAMDLRADLAAITAPTLVVAGADDLATPVEHAETIIAAVDGARLAVVDSAAHLANVEQPEAVTTLLLEHFDRG